MTKTKLSYKDSKNENITNPNILLVSFKEKTNKNENVLIENSSQLHEEEQINQMIVENDQQFNDTVNGEREQWSNKIEYMLSVIGYVVDLGSLFIIVNVDYRKNFKTK